MYVSITGLRLKSVRQMPRFWWYAIRAMRQAKRAPGNILAETRTIDGVHHTLSVWENEAAMRRYLVSGAHREAMRVFPEIASGSTLGYEADTPPDWNQVHDIWLARGVPVVRRATPP
ncbi:MAG: hypothetical protein A4S14_14755 [Proteobacteria bacterium SG_bin9]|nr:MAG: hypothetical protein A4S14_14755 [Proteobacteria bacterium SG_bin9]